MCDSAEMDRRAFLVAGGAFIAAGLAAGARWLSRAGDSGAVGTAAVSPSTTSFGTPSSSTTTSLPTTIAPTTTSMAPSVSTTSAPSTTAAVPDTFAATIICRTAWGARPVAGPLDTHTIERLTVHHTAVALDRNSDAPAHIRGHQKFHQDSGWADLAYHYMVDAHGNVYEGRPFDAPGDTFTGYDPAGHFLVCCEGNFDQQSLPAAQLDALAAMLAWGADRFSVSPSTIGGHRDYASTTCPGTALAAVVSDGTVQEMVESLIAAGGVELVTVCDEEGEAVVTAIEAGTA